MLIGYNKPNFQTKLTDQPQDWIKPNQQKFGYTSVFSLSKLKYLDTNRIKTQQMNQTE